MSYMSKSKKAKVILCLAGSSVAIFALLFLFASDALLQSWYTFRLNSAEEHERFDLAVQYEQKGTPGKNVATEYYLRCLEDRPTLNESSSLYPAELPPGASEFLPSDYEFLKSAIILDNGIELERNLFYSKSHEQLFKVTQRLVYLNVQRAAPRLSKLFYSRNKKPKVPTIHRQALPSCSSQYDQYQVQPLNYLVAALIDLGEPASLIQGLESIHPEIRLEAIDGILWLVSKDHPQKNEMLELFGDKLVKNMGDPYLRIRFSATVIFRRNPQLNTKVGKWFTEKINEPRSMNLNWVKNYLLLAWNDPKLVEPLDHALRSTDTPTSNLKTLLQAFCRNHEIPFSPKLLDAIAGNISHVDNEVRSASIYAITAYYSYFRTRTDFPPKLILTLAQYLETDLHESVRLAAADLLSSLGETARPAVPHLKKALSDSSPRVRVLAKSTLDELGETEFDGGFFAKENEE